VTAARTPSSATSIPTNVTTFVIAAFHRSLYGRPMTATLVPTRYDDAASQRIEKLNTASLRRVIDPDKDLPGTVGDGQPLPDELLSIAGLPELDGLTAAQRRVLAREELASIVAMGLRFEAALMAGFALRIAFVDDLTDPRVVYALHEVGEETRHSRLFSRLLADLRPTARNPLQVLLPVDKFFTRRFINHDALFDVLVLGGEEIPDLFQKRAAEHPDTDPFLREVNRYHRAEEARHVAYARTVVGEHWAGAGPIERLVVRRLAPTIIAGMFDTIVHPGVYAAVGLPTWRTWRRARRSAARVSVRHEATRPIVKALLDTGVFGAGRVPRPWRRLAGVDRAGAPVATAT
jgi:hypothetical protein